MEPLHLMLVEKHAAVRFALETRLASSPLIKQVDTYADVTSALHASNQVQPDLILLGLDGYRVTTLRQKSEAVARLAAKKIPIMVLVPYMDELQRELLLQAGASYCCLKNINTPQLLQEIEQVVQQHRPKSGQLGSRERRKETKTSPSPAPVVFTPPPSLETR